MAASACAPTVDIIAAPPDAAMSSDASLPGAEGGGLDAGQGDVAMLPQDSGDGADVGVQADAPDDAGGPACDPLAAVSIYLAGSSGELYRFSYAGGGGEVDALGVPDCGKLPLTVATMAVQTDGTLWLVSNAGEVYVVDPSVLPLTCKGPLPLKIAPATPLLATFLPATPPASGPLYVLSGTSLLAIDPNTYVQAPVGTLEEKAPLDLSGTSDGRLFALRSSVLVSDAGMKTPSALLDQIDPGDGIVSITISVPLASGTVLYGGAASAGSYVLFTDLYFYVYDLATGVVAAAMKEPMPTMDLVAVAAAPCPATE